MKKLLVNYGGILFFYLIVVLGVLSLCTNNINSKTNNFKTNASSIIAK